MIYIYTEGRRKMLFSKKFIKQRKEIHVESVKFSAFQQQFYYFWG